MIEQINRIKLAYIKNYTLHFKEYHYRKLRTKMARRSGNVDRVCFRFEWSPVDRTLCIVGTSETKGRIEVAIMEVNMKEIETLLKFLQRCLAKTDF